MRSITGEIAIPANAPVADDASVLVEIRDTSVSDAPSTVLAAHVFPNTLIRPGEHVRFQIATPEVDRSKTLTLRAHVSLDGSGQVKAGDLLTVASFPVANTGDVDGLRVSVAVI